MGAEGNNPDTLKDYVGQCRKAAEYMRLIQHCKKCDGKCTLQANCASVKELLVHIEMCTGECTKKGCLSTKKIIQHNRDCRLSRQQAFLTGLPVKFCLVCSLAARDETPAGVAATATPTAAKACPGIGFENPEIKRKTASPTFEIPMIPKRFRENSSNTGTTSPSPRRFRPCSCGRGGGTMCCCGSIGTASMYSGGVASGGIGAPATVGPGARYYGRTGGGGMHGTDFRGLAAGGASEGVAGMRGAGAGGIAELRRRADSSPLDVASRLVGFNESSSTGAFSAPEAASCASSRSSSSTSSSGSNSATSSKHSRDSGCSSGDDQYMSSSSSLSSDGGSQMGDAASAAHSSFGMRAGVGGAGGIGLASRLAMNQRRSRASSLCWSLKEEEGEHEDEDDEQHPQHRGMSPRSTGGLLNRRRSALGGSFNDVEPAINRIVDSSAANASHSPTLSPVISPPQSAPGSATSSPNIGLRHAVSAPTRITFSLSGADSSLASSAAVAATQSASQVSAQVTTSASSSCETGGAAGAMDDGSMQGTDYDSDGGYENSDKDKERNTGGLLRYTRSAPVLSRPPSCSPEPSESQCTQEQAADARESDRQRQRVMSEEVEDYLEGEGGSLGLCISPSSGSFTVSGSGAGNGQAHGDSGSSSCMDTSADVSGAPINIMMTANTTSTTSARFMARRGSV